MVPTKSIYTFISSIYCIITFSRAQIICDQQYNIPNWELDEAKLPARLRLGEVPEVEAALEAQIDEVRENFTLSLFAIPFNEEPKLCPPADTSYHLFRKHCQSYFITVGSNKTEFRFGNIFSGCYYVEMMNTVGERWIWNPAFFNTGYPYFDIVFKCNKFQVIPEDYDLSRQLKYEIEVPMTCIIVQCSLFELDEATNNTKRDLQDGRIPPTQVCSITKRDNVTTPYVECQRRDVKPRLFAIGLDGKNDSWKAAITWDFLKRGGADYSTSIEHNRQNCNISYSDAMTWKPVLKYRAVFHGFRNDSNTVPVITQAGLPYISITSGLYIFLTLSVTAVLVYWMSKYVKILIKSRHRENTPILKPPGILQLYNKEESNHILLIYARDSPKFMKIMNAFRKGLQQSCQCPVHDLYSIEEWNSIASSGAMGWVEDLLRAGSKVVWVDTPHFRSVLRESKLDEDQRKQYIAYDFRDEAVPYAVSLATDLFQNVTTQYRCHFVVWVEGYEIEDDNDDDPLMVVSPHARYRIPEHLPFLCEHLVR